MGATPEDNWNRTRQMFADQFEQDGTSYVYRRSQKGEAFRVTLAERDRFLGDFDAELRRAKWIIYSGLGIMLGGLILLSARGGRDLSEPLTFAAIGAAMIPHFVYFRWAWAAPARALAGRTPVAGERSPEEVRRLRFQRISYGQLAAVAFGGLAIPVFGAPRHDIFSGSGRLWLAAGAGLLLLAAVQSFRKWRTENDPLPSYLAPPASGLGLSESNDAGAALPNWLNWRTGLALAALIACALLFLTPFGKSLTQKPSFMPILMLGMGAWAVFTVVKGFAKGRIEPFVRGVHQTYEREAQPKRFWASMAWNSLFGGICFFAAFGMSTDNAAQNLQDRCYNAQNRYSPSEVTVGCDQLLEKSNAEIQRRPSDATAYFNRGFAYEHRGDLDRAVADFTEVIRLNPDQEGAYYYRWAAYKDLGDEQQAAADLAALRRLDPKFAATLPATPTR